MKKLSCLIAVALLAGISSFAQQTANPKAISKSGNLPANVFLLNGVTQIPLPPGEGAWTVQILTRGGIIGNGKDALFLTSAGDSSCRQKLSTPNKPFASESLQSLNQLVSKIQILESLNPLDVKMSGTSLCNDCYKTAFILSRRESDGTAKTLIAEWDATTRAQIAKDVLQTYERVIDLLASGK